MDAHTLTDGQQRAFTAFKEGHSMFITGPAGCGKSYLIQSIKEHCDSVGLVLGVTAMTGTAASLIGGQTLHTWGGLGLAQSSAQDIAKGLHYKPPLSKRWKDIQVLIIDEISMMSAELFNKIHTVAQLVRRNTGFFGGIQLVCCGDFLQLEPIGSEKFCFESTVWEKNLTDHTYYLPTVIRQTDPVFQKILSEIRLGVVSRETKEILNSRLITDESEAEVLVEGVGVDGAESGAKAGCRIKATVLFPRKKDVERINLDELNKLIKAGAEKHVFTAEDSVVHRKTRAAVSINKTHTDSLNKCTAAAEVLTLVVGTQVMLLKNKDVEQGLVNGSRGVILKFDGSGYPTVVFDNGIQMIVAPESFEMESGVNMLIRKQLPLTAAWALTIHKCQGATLSNVITDLSDVFGHSQVYVTLSRVRSLEGLFIVGINYNKITCNPKVKKYYMDLQAKSR